MHLSRYLAVAALVLLLGTCPVGAVEIPDYTPNVVDASGVLGANDRQRINQALQQLRDTQHVWGAVYIVPSLEGDSIESLADRAFAKWRLGRAGSDNGLLLVLAIQERRSRFEVGYGLEGTLTDLVARHALDDALAPRMRQGDTTGAIVEAFGFMGRVVAKDPATLRRLEAQTRGQRQTDDKPHWLRGLACWLGWVALLWLLPPVRRWRTERLRERLMERHPELVGSREDIAPSRGRSGYGTGVFIKVFMMVNPGVFVMILSAMFFPALMIILGVELLVLASTVYYSGHRYRSRERFLAFLKRVAEQRETLIRRGHVARTSSGTYAYTPEDHASQRASSSSSSSSSDSSGSSSSDGGSSGGGGASSSW